jgi:hypothetical protein
MLKKAVIILGMHRSGTSVITAGLEMMGISLGNKYTAKGRENPKGYFENKDVRFFNDRLLKFLHSRWDNPLFDGRKALDSCEGKMLTVWHDEAHEIFLNNFLGKTIWALKDPRMCQLLPFWISVFERNGFDSDNTLYVHVVRNPLEVALSQQQRHKTNPNFHFLGGDLYQTVLLWLSSHFQALREVNSDHNMAIAFDDILDNPALQIARLSEFLGIEVTEQSTKEYLSSFLEKGLKHHNLDRNDSEQLEKKCPDAKFLYDSLSEFSKSFSFSRNDIQKLLASLKPIDQALDLFLPVYPMISDVWYNWQDTEAEYKVLKKKHELVIGSYAWKIVSRIKTLFTRIPGSRYFLSTAKKIFDMLFGH